MTDHRPPPRPAGFSHYTAGQKVVTIVTMLAMAAGGLLFAYWAARPANTHLAAGAPVSTTSTVVTPPRTSADDTATAGGNARVVAYQNRLNASLQTMLDTVVGPGHSVATTTAELDLDDVETTTRTYTSDPKVAALAESISRQAWRGAQGRTTGVLGPGNDPAPAEAGTNGYDYSRIVRNNAINQVTETRRRAPGTVTRLHVAVLLNATTAAAVGPARIEQLVSNAVGYNAARGDTMAIAAMPFDTSIADQAQRTITDTAAATAATERTRWIKLAVLGSIVLLLGFLAWRTVRRARHGPDPAALIRLQAGQAIIEQQRLVALSTDIPKPNHELGRTVDSGRQRALEQLIEDEPKEVTALVREWIDR